MACDLCGAETSLVKTVIEGVELSVCPRCSQHGKVLSRQPIKTQPKKIERAKPRSAEPEPVIVIDDNFASKIKNARQNRGMSQKDLAKNIAEKESVIHKVETGSFEPSIDLAKKFERALGLSLVREEEDSAFGASQPREEGLTLGDFVKIRKRS